MPQRVMELCFTVFTTVYYMFYMYSIICNLSSISRPVSPSGRCTSAYSRNQFRDEARFVLSPGL